MPKASKKLRKLGITGGIGSGKSTACRFFEALGVPVYYADNRAKALMLEEPLRSGIENLLGKQAYQGNGQLDRAYIAQRIFTEPQAKEALEALVHPAVAADYARWAEQESQAPYCLKEAALLFETGSAKELDAIVVVSAPEELRLQRVMQRDGISEEAVRQRMQKQLPQSYKEAQADFILYNTSLQALEIQVQSLHLQLLNMGNSSLS